MKPNFDSPAHTIRQILDRNLTLYMKPGKYAWKDKFVQSDVPELREIAKTMIITKSWDEFDNLTMQGLLSSGTHTQLTSTPDSVELEFGKEYNHDRGFYRGEQVPGDYPYNGLLTSKNWHLNEEFKNLKDKLIKLIYCPYF